MKIKAIILCKKNSQRLKNKNTRKFSNFKFGLLELKIRQLLKVAEIDQILISTDDEKILKKYKSLNKKITTIRRDKKLCLLKTRTEDLIKYIVNLIPNDKILWTQVSSPLVDEKIYKKAVLTYKKKSKLGFDSLMSVTSKKQFLWDKNGPLNYKVSKRNKWPKTQDLNEIFFINSAIFIFDKNVYMKKKDRIGNKPFYFSIKEKFSIDIDDFYNFKLAEVLYKSKIK